MTAKGLLDLHANSSILSSHSQTTGKMRLCASFQTGSCLLHITHTHTHKLLLGLCCPEAKNQLEIVLHVLSKKPAKNCKGQHVFCPLVRTGLQIAAVDEPLNVTAAQLVVGRTERFLQDGLQLPHAFLTRAEGGFLALVSHTIVGLVLSTQPLLFYHWRLPLLQVYQLFPVSVSSTPDTL